VILLGIAFLFAPTHCVLHMHTVLLRDITMQNTAHSATTPHTTVLY